MAQLLSVRHRGAHRFEARMTKMFFQFLFDFGDRIAQSSDEAAFFGWFIDALVAIPPATGHFFIGGYHRSY